MTETFFNSVVIGGDPGSGKSTTIDLLKERVPWIRVYSVGDVMRSWHEEERPDITFKEYYSQLSLKRMVDANIELKEMVDFGQVQVADSRLVDIFDDSVLKVGLFCPYEIRAERLSLSNRKDYRGRTVNDIIYDLKSREETEIKQIRETREMLQKMGFGYPLDSEGNKIKDFNNYNHRSKHYYDLPLYTNELEPEEVADSILEYFAKDISF